MKNIKTIIISIIIENIISLLVYPNAFNTPIFVISSSIDSVILNLLTNKLTVNTNNENAEIINTNIFAIANLCVLDCSS